MSETVKKSADMLISNNKLVQKKNKEEKMKKSNKITKTEVGTADKKISKTVKNIIAGSEKTIVKKRGKPQKRTKLKNIWI